MSIAMLIPPLLLGLNERVTDIVESFGYVGITLLVILETVFPPIPSEVILPLAGFMSGQGELNLIGVLLAATIGSIAGALLLYGLGHWFGQERLRLLIARYGRYCMVKEADLDRAQGWFDRRAGVAVLVGRLVPGIRSIVSIPAGLARMPLPSFIGYTALGSAVWNGILVILGWWLGDNWDEVRGYAQYFEYAVVLGVLATVVIFLWKRRASWGQT
jgi:membrane protein DedA with SNARE-associated domain